MKEKIDLLIISTRNLKIINPNANNVLINNYYNAFLFLFWNFKIEWKKTI